MVVIGIRKTTKNPQVGFLHVKEIKQIVKVDNALFSIIPNTYWLVDYSLISRDSNLIFSSVSTISILDIELG